MRLIDADAIRLKQGFFEEVDNVPKFYDWLDEQPTVDAVQVVRCKDCKHFKKPLSPDMWGWCKKVSMDNKATVEDWFCADGVRDISKSDERQEKE